MRGPILHIIKQAIFRISLVGVAIMLAFMIYFSIDLPYSDIILPFSGGHYFWFDGRRLAFLSMVPLFAYVIYAIVISVFSKTLRQPKKLDKLSSVLAITCFAFLVFFNVLSLCIYLYIAILTPYKPCIDNTLTHYFVIDYSTCRTIVNNEFN